MKQLSIIWTSGNLVCWHSLQRIETLNVEIGLGFIISSGVSD